jgi:hypothetical protein
MKSEAGEIIERIRRFAMPEGDVAPREIRFIQEGEMRLSRDAPWRPFRAEQRMSGEAIDFRWRAWWRMAPFTPFRVTDAFESGAGRLSVSAFGVLPVARGRGLDFDRGEVQRALAELPWRPFAFGRLPHVTWESRDGRTLAVIYDDGRVRASAELEVDREGRVTGGSAVRPRLVGKTSVKTFWRGAFGEWRRFGRVRIPTAGEVAWILPEGPFTYWRGRIISFPAL